MSSVVESTESNMLSNDFNGTHPLQCFSYVDEEELVKIIGHKSQIGHINMGEL